MKALLLARYGSPKDLQLVECDRPVPGEDQVLVKVHSSSINDWEWGLVRGQPWVTRMMFGWRKPRPTVLGTEVAGRVVALGKSVSRFQVGDAVYGDLSDESFGGLAEYLCVNPTALCPIPEGMSFIEAAAVPHAALLALQGLVDKGALRPGDKVLINGAGGGVGVIALQLAKRGGSHVTGVDAAHKLDALLAFGFDQVINYQQQDFTRSGERYDAILDTKTKRSPFRYLAALNPGGRYVSVGGDLLRLFQLLCLAPLIHCFTRKRLRILALKPNKGMDRINQLYQEQGLRLLVDGPYPLEQAPEAIQRFGDSLHVGKVVIHVTDESEG